MQFTSQFSSYLSRAGLLLATGIFLSGCNHPLLNRLSAHTPVAEAATAAEVRLPDRPLPKFLQVPPVFSTFDGSIKECDVLVIGGTPSGVAAALAAARRGAKVVLIEDRPHLGGDIVYQMLNMWDVPLRPKSSIPVVRGIFEEFYQQLGLAFDIGKAMDVFENTVAVEPGLHTYINSRIGHIFRDGNRVTGAIVRGQDGPEYHLKAKCVVDSTDDASFATRAGASYFLGRQKTNPDRAMQSVGLLFSVSGVQWNKVRSYVKGTRRVKLSPEMARIKRNAIDVKAVPGTDGRVVIERLGGADGDYIFESGDMVADYIEKEATTQVLSINFGKQRDNTIVLNTLNVTGVNGLSEPSVANGIKEAEAELPHLMDYLREKMPGFEKAQVADIAPELYVRETRHIQGLYLLTETDIKSETRFPDRIALASYPIDLHPYKKGDINPMAPRRYNYTIPLRCLIPTRLDNVIVASRSLSATSAAAGSARVLPITMACGEAAGAAAWLCTQDGITPHQLVGEEKFVAKLQDTLRDWGADIGDEFPERPKTGPVVPSRPVQKLAETASTKKQLR